MGGNGPEWGARRVSTNKWLTDAAPTKRAAMDLCEAVEDLALKRGKK